MTARGIYILKLERQGEACNTERIIKSPDIDRAYE